MIKMREFEAGQVIFRENEWGETAYVIERGRVEILKSLGGTEVHIAYINRDQPFGEMSMIDEKPRSATAIAVETTVVQELHREDFMKSMQSHPTIAINLLRVLFERLREADATIIQLYKSHPEVAPPQAQQTQRPPTQQATGTVVTLQGLTPEARHALSDETLQITRFPFRIGRQSEDALTNNHLSLPDRKPFQISRNHLAFMLSGNRVSISDRGSALGSMVDGKQVGGHGTQTTSIFLNKPETMLVLGDPSSPYQFKVTVEQASAARKG